MICADDSVEENVYSNGAPLISPDELCRKGVWDFTKILLDDPEQEDDYTVTMVSELVAALQVLDVHKFNAVVLRFGMYKGRRFHPRAVAQVLRCSEKRALDLVLAGTGAVQQALIAREEQLAEY